MIKADFTMPPGTLIHELPPSHTIHRQVLSRVFTPKAMLAIEPDVREICATRLDELVDRGSFDWVQDFARFIPMRVFGKLLGIADDDQERVLAHVEAGMSSEMGKPQEYGGDDFLTGEFYAEFVDDRIEHPGNDLITRLLTHEFDDEHGGRRTLTRAEALAYMDIIAGAGNHTTNRLITWTGKVFADHPDARAEVVADRSLIPKAIEETLRYEPSSTQIARLVTRDVEWHGQRHALHRGIGEPRRPRVPRR
jgi:cytochrome P450